MATIREYVAMVAMLGLASPDPVGFDIPRGGYPGRRKVRKTVAQQKSAGQKRAQRRARRVTRGKK